MIAPSHLNPNAKHSSRTNSNFTMRKGDHMMTQSAPNENHLSTLQQLPCPIEDDIHPMLHSTSTTPDTITLQP